MTYQYLEPAGEQTRINDEVLGYDQVNKSWMIFKVPSDPKAFYDSMIQRRSGEEFPLIFDTASISLWLETAPKTVRHAFLYPAPAVWKVGAELYQYKYSTVTSISTVFLYSDVVRAESLENLTLPDKWSFAHNSMNWWCPSLWIAWRLADHVTQITQSLWLREHVGCSWMDETAYVCGHQACPQGILNTMEILKGDDVTMVTLLQGAERKQLEKGWDMKYQDGQGSLLAQERVGMEEEDKIGCRSKEIQTCVETILCKVEWHLAASFSLVVLIGTLWGLQRIKLIYEQIWKLHYLLPRAKETRVKPIATVSQSRWRVLLTGVFPAYVQQALNCVR